ncbi:MAG: DUF1214 domain-containing protein [Betaproteobacteria bacterium]
MAAGRARLRGLPWAAAAVLAVALGAGSAGWVASRSSLAWQVGPWATTTLAGSPDADPWTRARVALAALLALNRSETMYYLAHTDSEGRALRSRCRYRVEGVPPAARWWSVTAYSEDHFLFDHPSRRYSLNSRTAQLDDKGRFALVTGPDGSGHPVEATRAATAAASAAPPGDRPAGTAGSGPAWLPTPGDRGLVLALRVYNPDASLSADPLRLDPPRITRLGDCP